MSVLMDRRGMYGLGQQCREEPAASIDVENLQRSQQRMCLAWKPGNGDLQGIRADEKITAMAEFPNHG